MDLRDFKKKWSDFVARMNKLGLPLPMVRDPKTGAGSVSLTLVFISFNMVLIGLIGKATALFGGIDIAQALNLFYACAALYFGRKMSKDGQKVAFGDQDEATQSEEKSDQKVDSPD